MAQLNKVFLMGNLTRDPELRRLANGTAVVDLGLALNRSFQGRDGERREEVVYVDVTVWDRQAETCAEYLKKGRPVHIEGYLKMDEWNDKTTGEKRSKLKIQADRVQFLGGRDGGPGGGGGGGDDDFAPPAREQRDYPPRRSAPEPRGGGGNAGGGGGGSRGYAPSNNAPPARRPPPPPVESDNDDDDIPF